jgi:hypothetical protein
VRLHAILRLGERTVKTFVIANNHFRGQAPANAIELLHLLGRTPAAVPRELLLAYPEIQRLIERCGAGAGPVAGPEADELANVFVLAIRAGVPASVLKEALFAYPTQASNVKWML